jgi:uncharacterized LabA/DUF88 family protein
VNAFARMMLESMEDERISECLKEIDTILARREATVRSELLAGIEPVHFHEELRAARTTLRELDEEVGASCLDEISDEEENTKFHNAVEAMDSLAKGGA